MTISAKSHALRFRIWQYASAREWDCTIDEIADALDISQHVARAILQHAGWTQRVRLVGQSDFDRRGYHALGTRAAACHIAADILSGRVGVDA